MYNYVLNLEQVDFSTTAVMYASNQCMTLSPMRVSKFSYCKSKKRTSHIIYMTRRVYLNNCQRVVFTDRDTVTESQNAKEQVSERENSQKDKTLLTSDMLLANLI